jgi:phosphoribosyl 1,2-cyclic phosphodiesterase
MSIKLIFPGTRGEIENRTRLHRMHSCLLVEDRVLIDYGADWLGKTKVLQPEAILLTHAHPDHAGGLRDGTTCEVFATNETWERLRRYPVSRQNMIDPRKAFSIAGCTFEAFPVEHSFIAPAVGYRISKGAVSVFYVPDLVKIQQRHEAMSNIALYIGDGASIRRSLLRRRGDAWIGHASVREQLVWCREEKVPSVVISHCGSQIVRGDPRAIAEQVRDLSREFGIRVVIAHDGMQLRIGSYNLG